MNYVWLKIICFSIFGLFISGSCNAQDFKQLDIDWLVTRHIDALGGYEKIKSINNLVYRRVTIENGQRITASKIAMSRGRPYYKLVGDKNNPGGYMEGYNGQAWEWFKNPGIVIKTVGEASEAIRHYAGVENPLIDYKKKGNKVEIHNEEIFENKNVIAVKVTRRDNFVEKFYIDKDTYLIVASSYDAPLHAFGEDLSFLTKFSDYQPVNGVLIAHNYTSVTLPSRSDQGSVQWAITANEDLPDDWFAPPSFKRTPLQLFIEQLYEQRADISALRWLYDEFRITKPEIDISKVTNTAAFQMLKMDQIKSAIELLKINVREYPESADSYYTLGRAYETADSIKNAKEYFRKSLKIDSSQTRVKEALKKIMNKVNCEGYKPESWSKEVFSFPLPFAPDIALKGKETIYFSPGWGTVGNDDFWTYSFIWCIAEDHFMGDAEIKRNLVKYFDGLIGRNLNRKGKSKLNIPQTQISLTKNISKNWTKEYSGFLSMYDYMREEPIRLNLKITESLHGAGQTKRLSIFFAISPKPYSNSVWDKMSRIIPKG